VTAGAWIRVEDRLPPDGRAVIVWEGHIGRMRIGRYYPCIGYPGGWSTWDESECSDSEYVTHWQPLPDLPGDL